MTRTEPQGAGHRAARGAAHVVVVGGGISGASAAFELARSAGLAGTDLRITVVDGGDRPGGKLRTSPMPGVPGVPGVDEGAEAFRLTAPMARLLAEIGLAGRVARPSQARPSVWVDGALVPLPVGTLMGIPTDPVALGGSPLLSVESVARVEAEAAVRTLLDEPVRRFSHLEREGEGSAPAALLRQGEDVAVGHLVAERLGVEVVDRLVGPLLSGVYAGDPYALSLRATLPALAERLEGETSLVRAARSVLTAGDGEGTGLAATGTSAFVTLLGGMEQLVTTLLARSGARVVSGLPVRALARHEDRWELAVGSAAERGDGRTLVADAVVLAVPASAVARLLRQLAPTASELLGAVRAASVAIVTLAYEGVDLPAGSGILVPRAAGTGVKAVTFTTQKWPHLPPHGRGQGVQVLRASVGRIDDVAVLQRSDEALAAAVAVEVARLAGIAAAPLSWRVSRWGGALPQYAPGHPELARRVHEAVADLPGVALAGATYRGVGVPACVESGTAAARAVLAGSPT